MPNPTDQSLAALAQKVCQGDAEAFAQLYKTLMPFIRRFVRSRGWSMDSHEIDDITNETFLQAWKSRDQFKGGSTFQTWLLGIASNILKKSVDRLRLSKLRFDGNSYGDPPLDRLPAIDEVKPIESEELLAKILEALETLPKSQREAFDLVHIRHIDIDRAAKLVKCSVTTFYQRLYDARRHLRSSLRVLELNSVIKDKS